MTAASSERRNQIMGKRKKGSGASVVAHFAGHETFPLRQMWLKKAFDQAVDGVIKRAVFADEGAIAEFGVGKNMVAAIRHWALACDVIKESDGNGDYPLSENGSLIFADDGYDPYAEHPTTAWYCHWCLAGRGTRATTWYWLFNHVVGPTFTRDELEEPLADYAKSIDANRRLSPATFSRDIETCIRGYAPRASGASPEEYAEPVLAELGLIYEEKKAHFAFRRGPKATLSDGMFAFALLDFWEQKAQGLSSLAFETIAYGEGSPGRVFKLDEESVAERLIGLADLTRNALVWTDTAGLRQVMRDPSKGSKLSDRMLKQAYHG